MSLSDLKKAEQNKASFREKRAKQAVVRNPHKVVKRDEMPSSEDLAKEETPSVDNFTFIKALGQGTYGVVRLVRSKRNHSLYALKILAKRRQLDEEEVEHVINESRIMRLVDFSFIVKHHASFQDEANLYILMEFVTGCDLYLYIQETNGFKERLVSFFAAQIVIIIEYLHGQGIVYRDLKPENLLVDWQGYLKLTDFSFAKDINGQRTDTFCGTPCYIAPEVVLQEGHGLTVDWWSLGILIYEMVGGAPPFDSEDVVQLYDDVLTKDPRFDKRFSLRAQGLITELLLKDPNHRLGSRGAQEVRSHPFFADVDWPALQARRIKSPLPMFLIEHVSQTRSVDVEALAAKTGHAPLTGEEQALFASFGEVQAQQ